MYWDQFVSVRHEEIRMGYEDQLRQDPEMAKLLDEQDKHLAEEERLKRLPRINVELEEQIRAVAVPLAAKAFAMAMGSMHDLRVELEHELKQEIDVKVEHARRALSSEFRSIIRKARLRRYKYLQPQKSEVKTDE
jgi:hypothetical protein